MEYDEQTKKSDDYLTTLEKAKEQYREYVEVSKIDDLPIFNEEQPIANSPPGKLTAVIAENPPRHPTRGGQGTQHQDHRRRSKRVVRFHGQTFPRKHINDGQRSKRVAGDGTIGHKVHTPRRVRGVRPRPGGVPPGRAHGASRPPGA